MGETNKGRDTMSRRIKSTAMVVCLLGAVMLIWAGSAMGQITGSSHDFTNTGGGSYKGAASQCVACHVPHNPLVTTGAVIPLQNHAETIASGWTTYSSTTMDATMGNPSGIDLLCLGCHDGSVAIDAYGGGAGTTYMSAAFKVGAVPVQGTAGLSDLSNDHPVSFSYDESDAADTGIVAVGSVPAAIKFFGAANDVKCSSCHDPHNGGGFTSLLRADPVTICSSCHIK